jgi:regulator of sigma E protease
MDIVAFATDWGWWLLSYLIPFLAVLTVVVFIHELGHFLVGRWNGVKVEAFAVGFGPELFGRTDRHGTRWKFCAVPLGGYVKFFGDANEASVPDHAAADAMSASDRSVSFFHKRVGQRAAIVAAGPIANFLLAIAIFAGLFAIVGKQILQPRVETIQAGSAAEKAGFRPGDLILSIDGRRIESFTDMQRVVSASAGLTLTFVVDRGGAPVTLTAVPDLREVKDAIGGVQRIGILGLSRSNNPGDVVHKRYDPISAVGQGVYETWYVVERTMNYIIGIFTGRESPSQLGSVIQIAQVSGHAASISMVALIQLAAVLSVSIGLLNLFPVPMLDGGHLVFYAAEAMRGKPLPERVQELGFRVGLVLLLALMLYATWNDLVRIASL